MKTGFIVKATIVAAAYGGLTILIAPISYGPVQFRITDALLLLPYIPYFGLASAIGLAIGGVLANLYSPYAVFDIPLGFVTNLVCGLIAWYIPRRLKFNDQSLLITVALQVVTITTLIGFILLHLLFANPLLVSLTGVAAGSIISVGLIGVSMIKTLRTRFPHLWSQQ